MRLQRKPRLDLLLTTMLVAACISVKGQTPPAPADSGSSSGPSQTAPASAPSSPQAPSASGHHYQPDRFAGKAGNYYLMVWGVDSLSVKWAESGEVIRFSYRIIDPKKAELLNDKKAEPELIAPQAGVKLVVPNMEKIGQLRQSSTPIAGKVYWMAFSNKGRLVKKGDRVSVQIGQFRADGLVVD